MKPFLLSLLLLLFLSACSTSRPHVVGRTLVSDSTSMPNVLVGDDFEYAFDYEEQAQYAQPGEVAYGETWRRFVFTRKSSETPEFVFITLFHGHRYHYSPDIFGQSSSQLEKGSIKIAGEFYQYVYFVSGLNKKLHQKISEKGLSLSDIYIAKSIGRIFDADRKERMVVSYFRPCIESDPSQKQEDRAQKCKDQPLDEFKKESSSAFTISK